LSTGGDVLSMWVRRVSAVLEATPLAVHGNVGSAQPTTKEDDPRRWTRERFAPASAS